MVCYYVWYFIQYQYWLYFLSRQANIDCISCLDKLHMAQRRTSDCWSTFHCYTCPSVMCDYYFSFLLWMLYWCSRCCEFGNRDKTVVTNSSISNVDMPSTNINAADMLSINIIYDILSFLSLHSRSLQLSFVGSIVCCCWRFDLNEYGVLHSVANNWQIYIVWRKYSVLSSLIMNLVQEELWRGL